MSNPFLSGRIPADLLDHIERYCLETGETKTSVLIKALSAYLNHPVVSRQTLSLSEERLASLEQRIAALEEMVQKQKALDNSSPVADFLPFKVESTSIKTDRAEQQSSTGKSDIFFDLGDFMKKFD